MLEAVEYKYRHGQTRRSAGICNRAVIVIGWIIGLIKVQHAAEATALDRLGIVLAGAAVTDPPR